MKKMIIYTSIIAVVIVLLVGAWYFMWPKYQSTSSKVTEIRDFSCPGMDGFTFKYPVFEGWEPTDSKNTGQSECTIHLSSKALMANNINTEISPQIKIRQKYYAGNPGYMDAPANLRETNINGISFIKADNHYDFWLEDSAVQVELWSAGGYGFSTKLFFKMVSESFKLTN